MNELYQQYHPQPNMQNMNPLQRLNYAYQAMRNPLAFVREQFPDVPSNMTDPNQILQYLQQTRNISQSQLMNMVNQFGR